MKSCQVRMSACLTIKRERQVEIHSLPKPAEKLTILQHYGSLFTLKAHKRSLLAFLASKSDQADDAEIETEQVRWSLRVNPVHLE